MQNLKAFGSRKKNIFVFNVIQKTTTVILFKVQENQLNSWQTEQKNVF